MRHPKVEVGTTLAGRFEIIGFLGQGGMAHAFRAHDLKFNRPAAVKVMQVMQTRTEEFTKRFEREARLADHAFHPHVLPVWDAGEDMGVFYIAMPLADTDLGALIEANPNGMDRRRLGRIMAQIAHALDHAHSCGVIHRDVKPENILLLEEQAEGDHAYLCDFGIAKDTDANTRLTMTRYVPMSANIAAPEQISEQELSGRTDQYALTCTFYEALAGQPPFRADDMRSWCLAHLFQEPPPISTLNPTLPFGLNNVLARGLAKDPARRYDTCSEMVAQARAVLRAVSSSGAARPRREDPSQTVLSPGRRRRSDETPRRP